MEANHPKSPAEMYADLAGIEEGGSLYTLQRQEPFTIEYEERISRTSKTDATESKDRLYVYLSSKRGKEYRIAINCAEDRCVMEHKPNNKWETYSTDLSGFRYRSPGHPHHGDKWEYDE